MVFLVSWLVFFAGLGRTSLWHSQEGRVVRIARHMVRSGQYLVPATDEDAVAAGKPPLYHWVVAGLGRWRGFDELTGRLPSAVAALLVVLLVYGWASGASGLRAGLVSALVLATSLKFVAAARTVRVDMLLTLWVTLAYLFFYLGYERRGERRWFLLMYVALALAVMTKGPVGLILPVLGIGAFLLCRRQLGFLRHMELFWGALLFLAIAGPWYVAVGIRTRGEFLGEFLGYQNLERFLGVALSSGRPRAGEPWWYYGPQLLLVSSPWTALVIVAAVWQAFAPHRTSGPLPALAWSWFLTGIVFFSISKGKRSDYLLPLLPALALLAGTFWVSSYREGKPTPAPGRVLALLQGVLLAVLALFVLAVGVLAPLSEGWAEGTEHAFFHQNRWLFRAVVEACREHLGQGLLLTTGSAVTAWVWLRRPSEQRMWVAFGATIGLALVFLSLYQATVVPVLERASGELDAARDIGRLLPPGEPLSLFGVRPHSLLFYLDRPTRIPAAKEPEAIGHAAQQTARFFCLTSPEHYQRLPADVRDQLHCVYLGPPTARRQLLLVANDAARDSVAGE